VIGGLAEICAKLRLIRSVEEKVAEAIVRVHDGDYGHVGSIEREAVVRYIFGDVIGVDGDG
jgi:hypothetical protein